jgi:hypothetical protein
LWEETFVRVWLVFAAMALLAGCASSTTPTPAQGGPGAPSGSTKPVTVTPSCPAALTQSGRPAEPAGGPIPADVTIAWVLRCRTDVQSVPGKGNWQVRVTERADGPATKLRTALNRPSEPRTKGPCPAIAMIVPYFVLVDSAGKGYLPALPYTSCMLPQSQFIQELNALPFHVVSSTPIRLVDSPLSQRSGCSQRWKDVVTIEAGSAPPAGPAIPWPSPPIQVRVCVYPANNGADGGDLIAGKVLDKPHTTQLLQAMLGSPIARACSMQHTGYAVILPAQPGGDPWYVELDGCERVLRPNHTLGQATNELLTLLKV